MGTGTNPFTDLAEVQGPLYATRQADQQVPPRPDRRDRPVGRPAHSSPEPHGQPRASGGAPRGLPPAPLADRACDLIVAAFCLCHSPDPASVIAEIARCLTGDETAVIAVKSADSHWELDRLMAASGLAPAAERRVP
jgi:SAM-dependent methyltransferase